MKKLFLKTFLLLLAFFILANLAKAQVIFQDDFDSQVNWQPQPTIIDVEPVVKSTFYDFIGGSGTSMDITGWDYFRSLGWWWGTGYQDSLKVTDDIGHGEGVSDGAGNASIISNEASSVSNSTVSEGTIVKSLSPDQRDLYVRFWFRTQDGWKWGNGDISARIFRVGHYDQSGSIFTVGPSGFKAPIYSYSIQNSTTNGIFQSHSFKCDPQFSDYNCPNSPSGSGDLNSSFTVGGVVKSMPIVPTDAGLWADGNWHQHDFHLKMNTYAGGGIWNVDGVLEFWYDGELQKSINNIKWINSGTDDTIGWNTVEIGGNSNNPFTDNWSSTQSYVIGDEIKYNGYTWSCTQDNNNIKPSFASEVYWHKIGIITDEPIEQWYAIDDVVVSQAIIAENYVIDHVPPVGGSVGYTDGYTKISPVAISVDDGADAETGINASSRSFERLEATLSGGICGLFDSFTDITQSLTGTHPNFTDATVENGKCYQYQYSISDNASTPNQATYTSTNVVKFDNEQPTFNVIDGTSPTPVFSDAINITVADSGAGISTRAYGYSIDNVCDANDTTIVNPFTSGITFNLTGSDVGWLCVKATDNADNAAYFNVGPLSQNNTPPETEITENPTNPTSLLTAQFSFTADKTGSTFECELDGGGFASCTTPKNYNSLAVSSHTFRVRATDPIGNIDDTPAEWTWTIDTTPPETDIDVLSQPTDPTKNTTADFTFTSDKVNSTFECKLDGGNFGSCTTPKNYTSLADGSHTFEVRAIDTANNIDASPATYSWTVDATAPDTTIETKPAVSTNSTDADFTFSTEAGATLECKLDGGDFAACTTPTSQSYTALTEDTHTFQVRATDTLGNVNQVPTIYTWKVDLTGPNIWESVPYLTITNDTTPSYTFTTTEEGTVVYGDDCGLTVAGAVQFGSNTVSFAQLLPDAYDNCTITVIDAAGNGSNTLIASAFTIDTTAPELAEVTAITTPSTNTTPNYTFSTDEAGTISYGGGCSSQTTTATKDANPETNNSITFDQLTDGTYSCTISVTDLAGNTSLPLAVTPFTVNIDPPVMTSSSPGGSLSAGTMQTIVSFTTDETAVCSYDITLGTAYASMPNVIDTVLAKSHSFIVTGLANGNNYTYFVRCKDELNNINANDQNISFSVANPVVVTPVIEKESSHKDKKKSTPARTITNSKSNIKNGAVLTQRGKKFSKNSIVLLYFSKYGGAYYAPMKIKTTSTGSFMTAYKVKKPKGTYTWYAVDTKTGKKSKTIHYHVKL